MLCNGELQAREQPEGFCDGCLHASSRRAEPGGMEAIAGFVSRAQTGATRVPYEPHLCECGCGKACHAVYLKGHAPFR